MYRRHMHGNARLYHTITNHHETKIISLPDYKVTGCYFKIEKAAGGLVQNENKEILFIYRFEKWDLPKGKIEKGESKKKAAKREVEEECGVNELKISGKLQNTYHIFQRKNCEILKVTYWYSMNTTYSGTLQPQIEEGITKVIYKNKEDVKKALENTYGNIKLLFENM